MIGRWLLCLVTWLASSPRAAAAAAASAHPPCVLNRWRRAYLDSSSLSRWDATMVDVRGSSAFAGNVNATWPQAIDYRRAPGVLTSVKDQGACGSCWAFSSAETLEGQLGLNGQSQNVSAQNFVDCVKLDFGCGGGWMDDALAYAEKHGVESLADYPYTGISQRCNQSGRLATIRPRTYLEVPRGDAHLREALVTVGPVSIALDATFAFQAYAGGVFDDSTCDPTTPNHALLLVGYDAVNRYWIVKNSWGDAWGEHGYIRINSSVPNVCGISSFATVAHIPPLTSVQARARMRNRLLSVSAPAADGLHVP